jgi:ABC-type branched-subunit amino acid transport system ATPase component/ABC-type branched-subunit amino acid transport system permease subunit
VTSIPARLAGVRPAVMAGVAVALVLPWVVSFSTLGSLNVAAYYALVAVSLVVLVGWVGQISLGHAGLVGVGAYVTGHVINGWHVSFPVNLLWAALAGAVVAGVLGAVAVRVRGLYLAVATLIFSWMAQEFLFRQDWFVRNGAVEIEPLGRPGTFPFFDWTSRRTFYYAAWAVVATAIVLVANLRDSKTGRAFSAVRGSEVAAASLGISVVRTKLTAFAVSGALAAMAGNLKLISNEVVTPDGFKVETSLFFLAIAVVGGLSSLGGAVAGSLLFAGLDELFFRVSAFSGWLEVVPPVLLTAALLLYREGLAGIPGAVRARFGRSRAHDPDPRPASSGKAAGGALGSLEARDPPPLPLERDDREVLLRAEGVTVRFGGLTAANDVSLRVCAGEIVGLIGPNGAGKTTMFNAIAGLNVPTAGRIELFGQDVTRWPVDARARLGVGRTFQAIQLLPQLTVFDNLLVATHTANPSGFLSHVFVGPATVAAERAARARVHEIAALLELESSLYRVTGDLPFGVLRMVELARALVTAPKLIMLDEPASGLDNVETERLADLLRFVRSLDVTLLLIEHDVSLVTSVSDYVYVLDQGALLAYGTATEIQRDPQVIAAYLGRAPDNVDAYA